MARILLVEDNPAEVSLFNAALAETGSTHTVEVASNGEEALERLLDTTRVPPDLIILDLNLPRKSGHEVLEGLKRTPGLKQIPAVILTSSVDESDRERAYVNQVNAYLRKPVGFNEFVDLIARVERLWLGLVQLPLRESRAHTAVQSSMGRRDSESFSPPTQPTPRHCQ